jgi:hypothetical protein
MSHTANKTSTERNLENWRNRGRRAAITGVPHPREWNAREDHAAAYQEGFNQGAKAQRFTYDDAPPGVRGTFLYVIPISEGIWQVRDGNDPDLKTLGWIRSELEGLVCYLSGAKQPSASAHLTLSDTYLTLSDAAYRLAEAIWKQEREREERNRLIQAQIRERRLTEAMTYEHAPADAVPNRLIVDLLLAAALRGDPDDRLFGLADEINERMRAGANAQRKLRDRR